MPSFDDILRVLPAASGSSCRRGSSIVGCGRARPPQGYVFDEVDEARIALIRELRQEFLVDDDALERRAAAARSALRDPPRAEARRGGDGGRCRRPCARRSGHISLPKTATVRVPLLLRMRSTSGRPGCQLPVGDSALTCCRPSDMASKADVREVFAPRRLIRSGRSPTNEMKARG